VEIPASSFLDEIDKIAGRESGPWTGRFTEGVQRDILRSSKDYR